jgi:hypothetical protein
MILAAKVTCCRSLTDLEFHAVCPPPFRKAWHVSLELNERRSYHQFIRPIEDLLKQEMEGPIMTKEYLVVLFVRNRRVMINGEFMGTTNKKLELERGPYEVTLGPPNNFGPAKQDVELRNTSSLMPMIVEFEEA